jgi:hypothetical protein
MSKKYINRILMIWVFLMIMSALLGRASIASDNGGASADFLNIGIGARAASLGGAFTALADGPNAGHWNPAGLGGFESMEASLSHLSWYQDINFDALGFALPVSNKLAVSLNAAYLDYGTIEGYDINDVPTGDVGSTFDMAIGVSAGYQLNENFSLGLGAKYINISIADIRASAMALDLGALYKWENLFIGAALSNLGEKLQFESTEENLPLNLRGGLAYYPFGPSFGVALEVENRFYGDLILKNGYEFAYLDRYFLRAGFNYFPEQEEWKLGQSLSFGAGALLGPAQFDYTFTPQVEFTSESLHRFSLTFQFGN